MGGAARGVSFAPVKASTALVEASGWNLAKSLISWGTTAVPALIDTIKASGSSGTTWLGGLIDDVSNTLRKLYLTDDTGAVSLGGKADEAANSVGPRFVAVSDGTIVDTQAPTLWQQIDNVLASLRTTGSPPPGVYQGGYRGQTGVYANLGGDLPPRPLGYYIESGVWPGAPGTERIIIGQQPGEVWYSPDHYGTFRTSP